MYSIVSRNLMVLFPSLYIFKLITKIFKLIKLENENIQGKRLAIMVLWVVSQWVVLPFYYFRVIGGSSQGYNYEYKNNQYCATSK